LLVVIKLTCVLRNKISAGEPITSLHQYSSTVTCNTSASCHTKRYWL